MQLNRNLLTEAIEKNIISEPQAEDLWTFLAERGQDTPGFRLTHILYYLGGLISIGAMSLFITLGWSQFGGWGLFFIALAYAVVGLGLTEIFRRRHLPIPAGIAATFVVVLTPLAVYGIQSALGLTTDGEVYRDYHAHIDWRWIVMELATLASGAIMLWRYHFPFLIMPIAITLWYMSMDLAPFLFGAEDLNWHLRTTVSLWFGLLNILLALWIDIRTRHVRDYAFWLYLFGVITFWGSLSMTSSQGERGKIIYLCINLVMIVVGATLARRVFVVFGGLGVAVYFGHLAYDVFENSMMFPFVVSIIGLAIVCVGIVWSRFEAKISAKVRALLPGPLRELIENRQ